MTTRKFIYPVNFVKLQILKLQRFGQATTAATENDTHDMRVVMLYVLYPVIHFAATIKFPASVDH